MPVLSAAKIRALLALLAFGLLGSAAAAAEHPVEARLLAAGDPSAGAVRLGVLLRMESGWHTYWQSGGDAGMATQVEWGLPAGWKAGPLQWPAPEKYREEGDLVAYGYKGEVLLFADVEVPSGGIADPTQIEAAVSWLVCREVCIPGDAALSLALSAAGGGADSLFAAYAARMPPGLEEAGDLELKTRPSPRNGGTAVALDFELRRGTLEAADGLPDLYLLHHDSYDSLAVAARGAGGLDVFLRPFEGESLERLQGLLVFGVAGQGRQYRYIDVDLNKSTGAAEEGIGYFLLLAIVGGLILNLMPCVLPVISLKVLGLVQQAGEEGARIRSLGLAFCAGMVGAFVVLAACVVALQAAGRQIGWGFQFQEPGFVAAMAALVFVLGLSLFGVFELRLPGMRGNQGKGLWDSVLNGVLATVLATPCSAPFLGTALGFAFTQPPATVLAVFVAIGLGMALPYGVLAFKPGWIAGLPKPGPWMVHFRQAMGFLLMATVLWLLWVLGQQRGVDAVVGNGVLLLALAVAAWLVGTWVDLGASALRRLVVWGLAAAVVLSAWQLAARPSLRGTPEAAAVEDGWLAYSPELLQRLRDENEQVFVDFTAAWCWTCKVNERAVLARPDVRRGFAETRTVLVKADWTDADPDITRLLASFGRSGVPLYVVYPRDPRREPIVLPEVITPSMVLEALDAAEKGS